MKIKIDENLPRQIAHKLKSFGHDVHTAQDEGLSGCVDTVIWEAARRDERFLITQDLRTFLTRGDSLLGHIKEFC